MKEPEFRPWPKTPRPKGARIIITQKMDGTNACVIIEDGEVVGVQSRNRLIRVGDDNMGFAAFVEAHKEELKALGNGYHYGEWAGPGIQKNPHNLTEKVFFLFNTARPANTLPDCVQQVEVLYEGPYSEDVINQCYNDLWKRETALGRQPEGLIVYHHMTKSRVKYTYANQEGKWAE